MGNGISTFFESGEDYQNRCGTAAQQAAKEKQERERKDAIDRCNESLRKDVWQGVSGVRDHQSAPRLDAPHRVWDTFHSPDCDRGPWPSAPQYPAPECKPDFQLTPPGDLKWGNQ